MVELPSSRRSPPARPELVAAAGYHRHLSFAAWPDLCTRRVGRGGMHGGVLCSIELGKDAQAPQGADGAALIP